MSSHTHVRLVLFCSKCWTFLFLLFSLLIYCSFCQGIADWELHPNRILGVLTNFSQKIRGTINSDLTMEYLIINNHSWSLLIVRDVARFWIFSAQHSERHSYLSTVLDLASYLTLVFRSVEYLFDLSNIFSSGNRLQSICRISFRSSCHEPRVTVSNAACHTSQYVTCNYSPLHIRPSKT